jgi:Domain of unknown function (DUF5615)
VITLLVDANLDGHAELLEARLQSEYWREFRNHLGIRFVHFDDLGLDRKAKDDSVWRLCQEKGLYLLTANRNMEDEDSLEATIRREGTGVSWPVFTLADSNRLWESTEYLDKVIESMLEYLLDEPNCRGTGRLFLPRRVN